MGYKAVCFKCRKSYSRPHSAYGHVPEKCHNCGEPVALLNQKFKPPKKSDIKAWEVVKLLYTNGFTYQHVYKDISKSLTVDENSSENYVEYPTNLKDANEFINTYKSQAHK
jgi:hypothetical protein